MPRKLLCLIGVLLLTLCSATEAGAQSLTLSLFERYLEALRVQAAIPGMSAAVLQGGAVMWEKGFGQADTQLKVPATPDTPFAIGGLSEALSSTLLLRKCVDQSYLTTTQPVRRWVADYPDAQTVVGHLLAHAAPGGGFKYDPVRFAQLTPVLQACTNTEYRDLLYHDLFERLAMHTSMPGLELAAPNEHDLDFFDDGDRARFADVVRRLAVPYRVANGKAVRSDVPAAPMSMQTGIITTVRDLERFDLALRDDFLLRPDTRVHAWSNVTAGDQVLPTGLGWFVQDYNGEKLVWQFGLVKDAWSSLILKLPGRDVTLILLANSDGLSAPFALENGDVLTSPFAKTFLKFIAP